jgi:hypothetical protein
MLERTDRDESSTASALIDSAAAVLTGRRSDIPPSFVAHIFARAVPEDVVRYGADDLAMLSERA